MCTESSFARASIRLRKSLCGLRLCHGLRGGRAAPQTEAVSVATHLFRCLLWHLRWLGCALPSHPPRGSLRVHQSFAGRPEDAHGGGNPTPRQAGRPPRTGGLHGRGVKPGRGPLRSGRRGSRCRGQGRRGWPEPATTPGRTLTGKRRGQFRQRRQPEEDRVDPPRPTAAFGRPSRQGSLVRERPREGRGEV